MGDAVVAGDAPTLPINKCTSYMALCEFTWYGDIGVFWLSTTFATLEIKMLSWSPVLFIFC